MSSGRFLALPNGEQTTRAAAGDRTMTPPDACTDFAPAGRDAPQDIRQQHALVRTAGLLQQTIDAMFDLVLILNGRRQIVGANRQALDMLPLLLCDMLGKRMGELVGCRNAASGPDGCGTAHNCATCGAVHAILESQRSADRVTRECRMMLAHPVGGALDLKVSATRVELDGAPFTILVLKDISDEKRLAVLTRLFFHDLMNTASGIHGYTRMLQETVPEDASQRENLRELAELADQLVEEIRAQRDLTCAEYGDLQVALEPVEVAGLLRRLCALHTRHPVASGRKIELGEVWSGTLETDERLIFRVLSNMIKNALEATAPGCVVRIACRCEGSQVEFRVHNQEVMPLDVQMQVFQRSFSTKAAQGRGLGTHSMKLFGERYLGGQVSFTSRSGEGTTFRLSLPCRANRPSSNEEEA